MGIRLGRASVGLAVACAGVVGCATLFDLDALENGSSSSSEREGDGAARPDTSAIFSESGADSPTDGGTTRYCASLSPPPTFCDDFDGIDAASVIADGSRAEPREDNFVSPPRALRITVDPLARDQGVKSAFLVPLSTFPHRLRCRFDLNVVAATGETHIFQFVVGAAGPQLAHLELAVDATGISLLEYRRYTDGGSEVRYHPVTAVRWPSGWMHVEVVWTDAFSASLAVNGAVLEQDTPLQLPWFQGLATVRYGNAFAGAASATERLFFLDNLVIDVE